MLSYGGLLKQKHKILNLDDSEEGNLINTSDEKTTEEEQEAHSIMAIWNYQKKKTTTSKNNKKTDLNQKLCIVIEVSFFIMKYY